MIFISRKIYEIAFELAGKLNSSFSSSFVAATKDMKKLDEKIRALNTTKDKVTRFRALKSEISETERRFDDAQAEVKRLAEEIRSTDRPTRELERSFERAKKQAGALKDKLGKQRSELHSLRGSLSRAGVSTRDLARDNARLTKEIDKATAAQRKLVKLYNAIEKNEAAKANKRGELFDTVALTAAVAAPVNVAMNFESAMADVRKVVDFEAPGQFKAMSKDILDLSTKIPVAADGLAQIVAAGGQAGIERENLTKFAEDAAKMAVAFDITADEAGQKMATWRTTFRLTQEQVVGLSDQINHLSNNTAVTAPRLSEIVSRVGSLGGLAGLTAGEVAALGAAMPHVEPEVASTGLKKLFTTLTAGEAATKAQSEALAALGFDTTELAKRMQTDAKGALTDFLRAIQKLPEEERLSYFKEILGEEGLVALGPLTKNIDLIENNLKMIGDAANYAGSMEEEFASRSETTSNSLQLLRNSVSKAGITVGSVLLPPLAGMAQKMATAANIATDFAEEHPALTKAIIYSTTAVIGLKIASVGLGYGWSLLKGSGLSLLSTIQKVTSGQAKQNVMMTAGKAKALGMAGATKTWALAQRALNLALRMNPIGLVITAIGALVIAGIALYKNWDTAREKASQMWATISDAFKEGVNLAIGWINALIEKINLIPGININAIGKLHTSKQEVSPMAQRGAQLSTSESVMKTKGITPHAEGGVLNKPHLGLVAEAGPEVIIPLTKRNRALELWYKTGQLLGITNQNITTNTVGNSYTSITGNKYKSNRVTNLLKKNGITLHAEGGVFGRISNNSIASSFSFKSFLADFARSFSIAGGARDGLSIKIGKVVFAPVVKGANVDEIMAELEAQKRSFMKDFKDMLHQQGRLAYD